MFLETDLGEANVNTDCTKWKVCIDDTCGTGVEYLDHIIPFVKSITWSINRDCGCDGVISVYALSTPAEYVDGSVSFMDKEVRLVIGDGDSWVAFEKIVTFTHYSVEVSADSPLPIVHFYFEE